MADSKLSGLAAITSASTDDLLYVVDDPGGTPVSKKITVDNLQLSLSKVGKVTMTQPATAGTITFGTDSAVVTLRGTDTYVGRGTTDTLTNKTLTSPTMTAPVLGAATATTVNKVTITAPTTAATLTLVDGSSLVTVGANAITL